jgi:hypothetical protein
MAWCLTNYGQRQLYEANKLSEDKALSKTSTSQGTGGTDEEFKIRQLYL